jgi:phage baseplate assembly protein W
MAIADYLSPRKKKPELYKDFHKDLRVSPVSKDLALLKDEDAVKDAIKNLILTDRGERPMQPYLGGSIREMLFENLTPGTMKLIKDRVASTIRTYEPRAQLIDVFVSGDLDAGSVAVKITFYVRNAQQPIELDVILKRNR